MDVSSQGNPTALATATDSPGSPGSEPDNNKDESNRKAGILSRFSWAWERVGVAASLLRAETRESWAVDPALQAREPLPFSRVCYRVGLS